MGYGNTMTGPNSSEAAALQQIRLEASRRGLYLWRNNSGALYDKDGRLVRYGLGNESSKLNKEIKSSDLIGLFPYIIRPQDVGRTVGIFTAIEVKAPGWRAPSNPREEAQARFIALVEKLGGFGQFATGPYDIWKAGPGE